METNETGKPLSPPWERKGLLSSLLVPAGWTYGGLMQLRNLLYDGGIFRTHRLPVPVVSVGNLTVGGTGKTPLVIEISRELLKRDPQLILGILSRGYRRKATDRWVVSDGRKILLDAAESGDEPRLIAKALPGVKVFVGADRVAVARKAIARYDIELLILDDAFQHRRIHRDVDILLVDGERGLDGGRVLPGGALREFPGNVRRASCVVISRFDGRRLPVLERVLPRGMPVFKARMSVSHVIEGVSGKEVSLQELAGKKVWAVCGIARPERFLKTLEALEVDLAGWTAFPDHHDYTPQDFQRVQRDMGKSVTVITTEKDWVKWEGFHPFREVYVVAIRLKFEEGDEFCDFIETFVYNRLKGVQGGRV